MFELPNLLRTILGIKKNKNIVYEIIANIDDMSSEIYSYFMKGSKEGALDIYTECIYMKKNRPAIKVSYYAKKVI